MSKSKGNVVDPFEQMSKFGVDPLRYFLLRDGNLSHDGGQLNNNNRLFLQCIYVTLLNCCLLDYSEERVKQGLNSDLADTLGNLVLRTNSVKLNPGGPELKFSPEMLPLDGSNCDTEENYELLNSLMQLPGIHTYV